jgi:hypothetical protein
MSWGLYEDLAPPSKDLSVAMSASSQQQQQQQQLSSGGGKNNC